MACHRLERGWASFNYLAGSETFSLGEVDDGEAFRDTMDAMITVGLTQIVSKILTNLEEMQHWKQRLPAGCVTSYDPLMWRV